VATYREEGPRREGREGQVIARIADGFSRVLREWEGETVALIGSGPSLTQEQCNTVRSLNTIAVNDAWILAPWADVLYFADHRWLVWHCEALASFKGVKVSIEQHMQVEFPPDVHVLRNLDNGDPAGLSLDPTGIKTGCNSGYQALNLAVLLGAKRIILLGYDYRFDGSRSHFFGDHPVPTFENHLPGYAQKFSTIENKLIELGIEVLNATPGTALNAFPKVSLEDVICEHRHQRQPEYQLP
jgi:hypothetical protein